MHNSAAGSRKTAWIIFGALNSCSLVAWDIALDWGLLQGRKKSPKHALLRSELAFKKPSFYYLAAVVNAVLRFAWTMFLFNHPAVILRSFLVALLEAFRRLIWNLFRVESEHIGK